MKLYLTLTILEVSIKMNTIDFLSNVLQDYCTLHNLEYISADELLYESNNHQELDCYTKLTSEQEDWLSCYITLWDSIT